ncbi:MAG TPA: hypothetical protein VHB73_03600, partial [Alphaproteobacteria bacterium]|nr:hypothetical protein [Alphaproteobacteria bacterium]
INQNLLEALGMATGYKNRAIVDELLKSARGSFARGRGMCKKLVSFLDSTLMEKENRNLVQFFISLRSTRQEDLSQLFPLLRDYFEPLLAKKHPSLNLFLKNLRRHEEGAFWQAEIIAALFDHARRHSGETIMLLLKSYQLDAQIKVSTVNQRNQHMQRAFMEAAMQPTPSITHDPVVNALYSMPRKDFSSSAVEEALSKAILMAADRGHETSLAFLLHASDEKDNWRLAALGVADEAVTRLGKNMHGQRQGGVHDDILSAIYNMKSAAISATRRS